MQNQYLNIAKKEVDKHNEENEKEKELHIYFVHSIEDFEKK